MTEPIFHKDLRHFHRRMDSLETRPELLTDFITPNDLFFVCNAVGSPEINLATFSLKIDGDGVRKPLALSYDALKNLPSYTVISYLECAGNQRDLFERVMGQPIEPAEDGFGMTKWLTGGVGNAVWTGVSLRTLLQMADLDPDTIEVNAKGLDTKAPEGGVNRPLPIAKALDPNTIVAYHMNGEPLPIDNGFPLRLIVPGWVGTNSIKWLGEIIASREAFKVDRNTKHYVFIGSDWDPDGETLGEVITTQNIKSSLALAWNATLSRGKNLKRGNARSPLAPIALALGVFIVLAAALIGFLAYHPALANNPCFEVRGFYLEQADPGPACTSPVGLCINGTYNGGLRGNFVTTVSTFELTADTPTTNVALFTADTTVEANVHGKNGTLFIKNSGAVQTIGTGDIVDLQSIIGGSGDLAGASGSLRASGTFDPLTGTGRSEYIGLICVP